MSLDAATLRRIAALKLPTEAFQEVLSIIADLQAGDEARRDKQRQRASRSRAKSRDNHVTVTSPQRDCHSDTPPVHIPSPKKKEPKKVLSMPIEPERRSSELNVAYARSKGWGDERIRGEWDRFKDHFLASGAKKRDWDATWRTWVTSPYQQQQPGKANGHANGKRTVHDAANDLLAKLRAFDEPAPGDLCDGAGEGAVRLIPPR